MSSFPRFLPVLPILLATLPFAAGQVPVTALTATALAGKTLNLSISGGEAPFVTAGNYTISLSSSGFVYSQPAAGATNPAAGSFRHESGAPAADAVLTLGNYFYDGTHATLSLLDSGFFELNRAGISSHQYGNFTISNSGGTLAGTPPNITSQPAAQTRELGAAVGFAVSANASLAMAYQWRKDGIDLLGATGSTHEIAVVGATDQGSYSVVVSTQQGVAVSDAGALTILPRIPVFTVQPLSASVFTGGSVVFTTAATGFPLPSFQWKLFGNPISGATSASFTASAEGTYTCEATNSVGSVPSHPATLAVSIQPGSLDQAFPSRTMNGSVTALLRLSDGKTLVGGGFNLVASVSRPGLYRLNTDGSIDTTFVTGVIPNNSGITRVVAGPAGKIYIVGSFTTIGGVGQIFIARLNPDGSHDSSFEGLLSSTLLVNDLLVQPDGKVVIGGAFTTAKGVNRSKIARLNTNGSLDTSFNSTGKTISGEVLTLALAPDGRIFLGGGFQVVHGVSRPCIAALTSSGVLDPSFDPGTGFNGEIKALVFQPDGKLLAGGVQTSYNGRPSKCLTRILADGFTDPAFIPAALTSTTQAGAYSLALQADGKIVVGGAFTKVDNASRFCITRMLPDGGTDPLFNPGSGTGISNPFVNALSIQADGGVLLGGAFTQVAGNTRDKLARIAGDSISPRAPLIVTQPESKTIHAGDPATLTVLAEASPISYQWTKNGLDIQGAVFPSLSIRAVLAADGGSYTVRISNIHGSAISSPAVVTVDTVYGALISQFAPASTIPTPVSAVLASSDGRLLIGGGYSPSLLSGLARANANGTIDTSFTTRVVGTVSALSTQSDGKILVAGFFDQVGGVSKNSVARLNADGALDPSFTYSSNNVTIFALAVQADGKILVAGSSFLKRLNSDGTVDGSFLMNSPPNGQVSRILVQSSGKIIVAGSFSQVAGAGRPGVARLNVNGTLDTGFPSSFNFTPNGSIEAQSFGKLVLGATDGKIYRLTVDGAADSSFVYLSPDFVSSVSKLVVLPDDRVFAVRFYNAPADGGPAYRLSRVDSNGTADTAFISGPGADGSIDALAVSTNGRLAVGGAFTVLNSRTRPSLAVLSLENPSAPVFTLQPTSRNAISGASTTLTALAAGTPTPTYQWKLNGNDIVGQTSATLVINPLLPSVSGAYTVTAINIEGTALSSQASVGIARLPVISGHPSNATVATNTSHTFTVTAASSVQPLSYQWRKNGAPLQNQISASLFLNTVTTAEIGGYDVIVTNADGSTTSNSANLAIGGTGSYADFLSANGLDPLTNGARSADPDGDGLSNIFEYIAGGNPIMAGAQFIPLATSTAGSFSYEFDRRKDFSAYGISIQTSDNLSSWNTAIHGQNGVTITAVSSNDTTEHVIVRVPAISGRRFVRVQVP